MSTFDTLMDWREGMLSDAEALISILGWIPVYQPQLVGNESIEAIAEIALKLQADEDAKAYQEPFLDLLDAPHYPVPATLDNADTALVWTLIHFHQGEADIDNFIDALECEIKF